MANSGTRRGTVAGVEAAFRSGRRKGVVSPPWVVGLCAVFLGLALALSSGCQTLRRPGVISGTVEADDGIAIAFEARGKGSEALVFVHGWSCDRAFWREQVDEFDDDYTVVTLDLPGHGASGAGRTGWSVAGLAADVEAVANRLSLRRMILIGHSMGGPICLEAARRMPGRVLGVIGVDTLHDVEFQWPATTAEMMARRYDEDFSGTMQEMVRGMFPAGADQALVAWVVSRSRATDREAAMDLFRDFPNFDIARSISAAGVPVRAVNAAPRPPMSFETEIERNRKYADFDAVLIADVGHYLMLERPKEFNEALLGVVEELSGR